MRMIYTKHLLMRRDIIMGPPVVQTGSENYRKLQYYLQILNNFFAIQHYVQ